MLRVCYAILRSYITFMACLEMLPDTYLQTTSKTGKADILSSDLSNILKEPIYWAQIHRSIDVFVTAVGSFLDTLSLMDDQPNLKEFRILLSDVRGLCAEIDRRTISYSSRLSTRMELLQFGRSIHESTRVQLLSLLAAIFLPLSLASSILSMQTRFADLGVLLYDFFGVIILLGTLTAFIVGALILINKVTQQLRRRSKPMMPLVQRLVPTIISISMFVPWALILTSFLIGMFKSVSLGIKILAAGLGLMVVAVLSTWGLLRISRDDAS